MVLRMDGRKDVQNGQDPSPLRQPKEPGGDPTPTGDEVAARMRVVAAILKRSTPD
jgi:hypothetical protein